VCYHLASEHQDMRDGKRILIIDDYEDARVALRMLLEFSGFVVRDFADGRDVREIVREWQPDVVCLDLMLPEPTGFEIAADILATFGDDRPLLVAVTGLTAEVHREKAAECGFDAYVVKPYDVEMLLQLLGRSRRRRDASAERARFDQMRGATRRARRA
jgi:DNA-binding response OmpR family regulator